MSRQKRPVPKGDENIRANIEIVPIITRLTQFVKGEVEMTSPQVSAALGLLKKALPDLQSVEHGGEISQTIHTISAEPMSQEEWERTYCAGEGEVPVKHAH